MVARGRLRIRLRPISLKDEAEFLQAVRRSRRLHRPWVYPPATKERFRRYVKTQRRQTRMNYSVRAVSGNMVGLINISEIVRGTFQSGYLGYYVFALDQRQGFILAGLSAAIARAFRDHACTDWKRTYNRATGRPLRCSSGLACAVRDTRHDI